MTEAPLLLREEMNRIFVQKREDPSKKKDPLAKAQGIR